jgi:signal transduction histidine kinase
MAVSFAALALICTSALLEPLQGSGFFTVFPAIVAAGWLGGTGPALTCAAATTIGAAWLMPPAALSVNAPRDLYRLLGLLLAGVLVAAVTGRLHRATARERALREGAERDATARARAEQVAVVSQERTRSLQALTAALSAARTRDDVARELFELGLPTVGAHAAGIWYRAGLDRVVLQAWSGLDSGLAAELRDVSLDQPVPIAAAVRTGHPAWLGSPEALEAAFPGLAILPDRTTSRAWAAVPLLVDGAALGALAVSFPEPRRFDAREREAVLALASVCAQAYERARLFEAERAARRRAEAAEEVSRRATQLQEQLLAVVGHDLRTPLSAILMSATSLRRHGALDARQALAVERIIRSTARMAELLRDLLDLVRIRQGMGLGVSPRPLAAGDVCRQAIAELQEVNPGRAVRLEVAGEPQLEADQGRLLQAVSNLIGNALQHGAADGEVRVRVESAGDEVRIAVTNRGPAIPAPLAAELFAPFRRGSGPGGGGLGLGLYIAREIARAHGGTIDLRSTDADGTTFTLRLPRQAATALAGAEVDAPAPS